MTSAELYAIKAKILDMKDRHTVKDGKVNIVWKQAEEDIEMVRFVWNQSLALVDEVERLTKLTERLHDEIDSRSSSYITKQSRKKLADGEYDE